MPICSRTSALLRRRVLPVVALCGLGTSLTAQTLKHHTDVGEDTAKQAAAATAPDHASSYYHYGLAHLYEDMAVNAGRPDYATQAVEEYKLALDADPDSAVLQNGLADLYFKLGRIREAITAAKDQVARNPNDLEAHKLLGKVYLRSLGDSQGTQSQDMLNLALAEYETLVKLEPKDIEGPVAAWSALWFEPRLDQGRGAVQGSREDRPKLRGECPEPRAALQCAG